MRGDARATRWPTARSGSAPGSTTRPGSYATTEELAALTEEAGRHGGFYHTHVRYPLGDRYLDPFREAIEIGRRAGAPAHITHFYHRETHPGGPEPLLALVDDARAEGLDVTFDTYPSEWASTRLLIQLPQWIQAGGPGPLKERLADRTARDRVRAEFTARGASYAERGRLGGRPPRCLPPAREPALGEPDRRRRDGRDRPRRARRHLRPAARRGPRHQPGHERAVRRRRCRLFVAHPVGMVGTDSTFLGDKPSPRTYGSFPRILGQFVRDEALLSLEEAIRKMTSAPAARLGLRDRGVIRDGAVADLVVFDPATVRSTATYDEPRSLPDRDRAGHRGRHARRRRRRPHRRDAGPRPAHGPRLSADGRRRSGRARAIPRCRATGCVLRLEVLARRSLRRSSANIRSCGRVDGVGEAGIGDRAGPAHREVQRDRARFEPQLAGLADALDEVDRLDLVGLGEQDPEPAGPSRATWSAPRACRLSASASGRQDPVAGLTTEGRRRADRARRAR